MTQESPTAFGLYASWLYTGSIDATTTNANERSDKLAHHAEFRLLADAYILGGSLLDNAFMDTIADALLSKVCSPAGVEIYAVGSEMVTSIYEGTTAGSPARLLMVDVFTVCAGQKHMRELVKDVSVEFLQDIAIAFASKKRSQQLVSLRDNSFRYHHTKS